MSGHLLSHSNSFGFEMEKDAAGCRALNRNFIVGGMIQMEDHQPPALPMRYHVRIHPLRKEDSCKATANALSDCFTNHDKNHD